MGFRKMPSLADGTRYGVRRNATQKNWSSKGKYEPGRESLLKSTACGPGQAIYLVVETFNILGE
jgi:hypothetical protein